MVFVVVRHSIGEVPVVRYALPLFRRVFRRVKHAFLVDALAIVADRELEAGFNGFGFLPFVEPGSCGAASAIAALSFREGELIDS